MPSPTNDLIARLAEDAELATPLQKPLINFFKGLGTSLLFMTVLLLLLGIRPDIAQKLIETSYLLELVFSLLTAMTAGISAIWLSFPDVRQQKWIRWLPFIPLAILAVVNLHLFYSNQWEWPSEFSGMRSGLPCFTHYLLYGMVPGVVYFFLLKRGAPTKCCWAGSTAFLSVSSMAFLSLRIIEPVDHMNHILLWHWVPLILVSLTGILAGKFILRW